MNQINRIDQIYCPTKVFFGPGSIDNLKEVKKTYKNIFILCDKAIPRETTGKIKDLLADSVESFVTYDLDSEPTATGLNRFLRKKTGLTDCVLGIGGGSILDSAKVLAIREGNIEDFNEDSEALPIITIPTTAGTGAELTKSAIVKSGDIKRGIRSEKLFPALAIVDPALCDSLPLELTKYTSFDALTHAVETYFSKRSNPLTRAISQLSLSIVLQYLPIAMKEFKENGKPTLQTRKELSYAAMLQGFTLSNASTCLPHRIQYALSTVSDAGHSAGLACVYRAWLNMAKPKIGNCDYKQIIKFMDTIGIYITLSDIGINKENIEKIVRRLDGSLDADPSFKDLSQVKKILEESL
ncbi:MAG: iron-containing alcohol dehydrogenase [Candidatus Aminicenantes bacterium]|nr:iron-containing alcohol dehydrogenase [Candidatus Aminicenantes bacterium]